MPESYAIPVPRDIPDHLACLIGCGVMTGIDAVRRFARVPPGSTVAIVGCGAVGLNSVQGTKLTRAGEIIAIDPSESRRALVSQLGATVVLDPRADDAIASVKGLSHRRGADFVFEYADTEPAMQSATEMTRPGSEIVILGKVNVDRRVSFRFGSLMGERRITRSSYGGTRPRRDFSWIAPLFSIV